MKVKEIITESKMSSGIATELEAKGYKMLGAGQDQDAYLAPDGTILKIFGTDPGAHGSGYSKGQQSFIDFADYCMKNEDNPLLPQFYGWERFEYPPKSGEYYLQIRSERLFEPHGVAGYDAATIASLLAGKIKLGGVSDARKFIQYPSMLLGEDKMNHFLLMIGGEENVNQLISSLDDLHDIANAKGYTYDLHPGNFMLGEDGMLVINDPFYTGSHRKGTKTYISDLSSDWLNGNMTNSNIRKTQKPSSDSHDPLHLFSDLSNRKDTY